MFTAQYGQIPYIKQITFRLLKVNTDARELTLNVNAIIFVCVL